MGRIIKLMALLAVLVIVVVIVSVLYVAAVAGVDIPVLAGVFRAEGEPISAEVIARGQAVERKIEEAVEDKSAFFLELTDEELTSLLLSKIDPDTQIRDARVTIKEGFVDISGSLNGRIGIPFGGSVDIALVAGDIDIAIRDISVGFLSLPGAAKDELQPLVDKALDLNRSLQDAGATQIQQLIMEDGRVVIVGVQQGGKTVSSVTVDSLQNALSSVENRIAPTPPGADVVPPGRTGGEDGPEIYLALGDSLAANVGAARPGPRTVTFPGSTAIWNDRRGARWAC